MTPTEKINAIKAGEKYTFKGSLTGREFSISYDGDNFILTKFNMKGKKVKQPLNTHALETIIFNALNPK